MMDNGLDVPFQVRDLAAMSLDNIEKAFAQFFDAATKSIAPNSAEIIALLALLWQIYSRRCFSPICLLQ